MRYLEVYQNLYKQELLYACQCTRKDYDSIRGSTELRYPGHCSEKKLKLPSPDQLSSDVSEVPFTVRLRIPENEYCFTEQHNSKIICEKPRNLYGDPVIRDRSGQWTYQYCVVIDDLDEEINLIVRGADLQSSTSRQLAFHMMLENERHISFLHHPLILNSQGFKLSKSIKSPPINSLRASGMSKEEIFGTALGLNAPLDLDKSIQSIQLKLTKDLT